MTERKHRGGILALLGNGLLLMGILVGLLRSFLSLHSELLEPFAGSGLFLSEQADSGILYLTLWAVLLALLTLAVWSLPRFRSLGVALLAAALAAALLYYRVYVAEGALLISRTITDTFHRRVGWFGVFRYDSAFPPAIQLDAILLALGAFMALLALPVGWCVVRARRCWAVILLTLPPLLPGLLASLYPDWLFFLMLAACWCTMLLTSLCRWAPPAGRGGLTLVALPAVGILLAILITLFPPDGHTKPDWASRAQTALNDLSSRCLEFLSDGDGTTSGTPTYVSAVSSVDLSAAGPLDYTGRILFRLTTDYTGHVYLRGTSMARYTGMSWEPPDSDAYQRHMKPYWGQQGEVSPLLYPTMLHDGGEQYTITIQNIGLSAHSVYLPYQLQDQEFSHLTVVDDISFVSPDGRRYHTVSFLPGLLDLTAVSSGGDTPAENAYQEYVLRTYLEEELPPEVTALLDGLPDPAASTDALYPGLSGQANGYLARAQQVTQLLARLCEYDQNTPYTPEGEDFVTYFLTESRRGYCTHFASAATLMLRHLGVPARYVSGFVADLDGNKALNSVRDSAAHAWVEIYLPDYGWYPVETTPGYTLSSGPDSSAPPPTESVDPSPAPTPTPSVQPTPEPTETPVPSAAPTATPAPSDGAGFGQILKSCRQALRWFLPTALVILLVWLGQYLPKGLRNRRLSAADTNKAILYGYRCLTRLERWGGQVEGTALELAQKARFSQHRLTPQEQQTITALFHQERQRIGAGLSPARRLLFRYFWGIPK